MPKPVKPYPVGLVGERAYQAAIGAAAVGDPAHVLAEQGNPYDAEALAVADGDGRTLGYIPRTSWLRAALLDEGRGCRATIDALPSGAQGIVGVTIAVVVTDDGPIETRDFVPAG